MSNRDKIYSKGHIEGQFVGVRHQLLDSAAWKHLSFGARALYVALLRHVDFKNYNNGKVFLSLRKAAQTLGAGERSVGIWFNELEHYGFIVQTEPGTLGPHGKATRWRITDRAWGNLDGNPVTATKDYLNWTGELFDRNQNHKNKIRFVSAQNAAINGKKCRRGEADGTGSPSAAKNTAEVGAENHGKKYRRSRLAISEEQGEQAQRPEHAPIGHNAGPPLEPEPNGPMEWTTPILAEIEYTPALRRLYRDTEPTLKRARAFEPSRVVDKPALMERATNARP